MGWNRRKADAGSRRVSPSPFGSHPRDLRSQPSKRRQPEKRLKVVDVVGYAAPVARAVEAPQTTAAKTACLTQEFVEQRLGIRQALDLSDAWQGKPLVAVGIAGSAPQGGFVDKQPRFLHPDRDHGYRNSMYPARSYGIGYFLQTMLDSSVLGVPMDKYQITGKQLDCLRYALEELLRRDRQATQIGKLRLDGERSAVPPQQPRENRDERAVGSSVGQQRIRQPPHGPPR